MATLDSFFPYIMPWLPGAPEPMVRQMLRDIAADFCQQSTVYQTTQLIDALANTQDYPLTVPSQARLGAVLAIGYGNRQLRSVAFDAVTLPVAYRGAIDGAAPAASTPDSFFQKSLDSTSISLYPIPTASLTQGIAVRVSWVPTQSATLLPDVLLNKWASVIGVGVAARMMMMPGQAYSNMASAGPFMASYEAGKLQATHEAKHGQSRSRMRIQPVSFL